MYSDNSTHQSQPSDVFDNLSVPFQEPSSDSDADKHESDADLSDSDTDKSDSDDD